MLKPPDKFVEDLLNGENKLKRKRKISNIVSTYETSGRKWYPLIHNGNVTNNHEIVVSGKTKSNIRDSFTSPRTKES